MIARILAAAFALSSFAQAEDWPRWRGPDLNGISTEKGLALAWDDEPEQLWTAQIGSGYSSVSVAGGRLFAFGLEKGEKKGLFKKGGGGEVLRCLDAATGKTIWISKSYASTFKPKYYDGGTSGTPTVDGEIVYLLRQTGELSAMGVADGKAIWQRDLAKDLNLKIATWGLTGAPLVEGGLLIVNAGEHGCAFDKKTGKTVWKSGGAHGYATPIPFEADGVRLVALFTGKALHAVDPASGKPAWSHPWETKYEVNAADPVLLGGGRIFVSSGYGRGAAVLKVTAKGAETVWENKNISTQFNPAVFIGGYLYGIDGNSTSGAKGELKCIDPKDGSVKWSQRTGFGGLSAAGDTLIILNDRGELITAKATPDGFRELARAQPIGKKCWTTPTLAGGKLYIRNQAGTLVCLDVSG